MDQKRQLLRHTLAALAYRGAKPLRDAPAGFAATRACPTCRSAGEMLAHVGDLLDWAATAVRGEMIWKETPPQAWEADVTRFFTALKKLDDYLAGNEPHACSAEQLFQGPIADAFTHIGQLATLRRAGRCAGPRREVFCGGHCGGAGRGGAGGAQAGIRLAAAALQSVLALTGVAFRPAIFYHSPPNSCAPTLPGSRTTRLAGENTERAGSSSTPKDH